MDTATAKQQMIRALAELVDKELVIQRCGSLSVKIDNHRILFTAPNLEACLLDAGTIIEISEESLMNRALPHPEAHLHAAVYRKRADVGAVLYTRQPYASAFSVCGVNTLKPAGAYKDTLGRMIQCIPYARMRTNRMQKNVRAALGADKNGALILNRHGALLFGKTASETVNLSIALEDATRTFLNEAYLKRSGAKIYDEAGQFTYVLSHTLEKDVKLSFGSVKSIFNSSRTRTGFILYDDEQQIKVAFDRINKEHPIESKLYNAIFKACPKINYIIVNNAKPIIAMEQYTRRLKPMLDDFAQQVGTTVRMTADDPRDTARMLKKSSVVLMPNAGGLCAAETLEEAKEISFILEKNCLAYLNAMIFKIPNPLKAGLSASLRQDYLKRSNEDKG